MISREKLQAAAIRVTAQQPETVGFWLAKHAHSEGLTVEQLAAKLHTDAHGLALLAVCANPRAEEFSGDVEKIATRCGVDMTALANLLRQEQGFAAWSEPSGTRTVSDAGWLLAAHDADQPPPGSDDDARQP